MKKLLFIAFILIVFCSYGQDSRKKSFPWLKSEDITNTRDFIWRGDTIDFTDYLSLNWLDQYGLLQSDSTILYVTVKQLNDSLATLPGGHDPVSISTTGANNGLSISTQVLSLRSATSSQAGALTSSDWNTFNNKLSAVNHNNTLGGTGTTINPLYVTGVKADTSWVRQNFLDPPYRNYDSLTNKPTIPLIINDAYSSAWSSDPDNGASRQALYNAIQSMGGAGATDLSYSAFPDSGRVNSNTGNNAILPLATTVNSGLLSPVDKQFIDVIDDSLAVHRADIETNVDSINALRADLGNVLQNETDPVYAADSSNVVWFPDIQNGSQNVKFKTTAYVIDSIGAVATSPFPVNARKGNVHYGNSTYTGNLTIRIDSLAKGDEGILYLDCGYFVDTLTTVGWGGTGTGTDYTEFARNSVYNAGNREVWIYYAVVGDEVKISYGTDGISPSGGVSSWNDLQDIPAGFADGVDNVGTDDQTLDEVVSQGNTTNREVDLASVITKTQYMEPYSLGSTSASPLIINSRAGDYQSGSSSYSGVLTLRIDSLRSDVTAMQTIDITCGINVDSIVIQGWGGAGDGTNFTEKLKQLKVPKPSGTTVTIVYWTDGTLLKYKIGADNYSVAVSGTGGAVQTLALDSTADRVFDLAISEGNQVKFQDQDNQTASEVSTADANNYFADSDVENNLQELGDNRDDLYAIIKNKSVGSFQIAHSFLLIGDFIYAGERINDGSPTEIARIIKFNKNTLSEVNAYNVGANLDVESMCYDAVHDAIYATRYNVNQIEILSIDPATMTLNGTVHTFPSVTAGGSPSICTDGAYIYGVTYVDPAQFFKIRISDWALVATNIWLNGERGHATAIDTDNNLMYVTDQPYSISSSNRFAKVSLSNLSYTEVSVPYVRKGTDDFAVIDDGSNVYVYIGGEHQIDLSYGGARIKVSDLSIVPIALKPSYALTSEGNIVYSTCIDGSIQAFNGFNVENVVTYKLNGYYPNEVVADTDGRIYMANFDWYDESVGVVFEPYLLGNGYELDPTASGSSDWSSITNIPAGFADGVDNTGTDDQTASEVSYSNTTSGLAATNVQTAIDELENEIDLVSGGTSYTGGNAIAINGSAIDVDFTEKTFVPTLEGEDDLLIREFDGGGYYRTKVQDIVDLVPAGGTTYTGGTGIGITSSNIYADLYELPTNGSTLLGSDYLVIVDGISSEKENINEINLNLFSSSGAPNGYLPTANGGGGISWSPPATVAATPPGGNNLDIQYNNGSTFGGFGSWDGRYLGLDDLDGFRIQYSTNSVYDYFKIVTTYPEEFSIGWDDSSTGSALNGGLRFNVASSDIYLINTSSEFHVNSNPYGSHWNGSSAVVTANDIYDKIESIAAGNPVSGLTSVGLSGGDFTFSNNPLTSNGTIGINLSNTGVTAGTYKFPSITVDAKGRATSISSNNLETVNGVSGSSVYTEYWSEGNVITVTLSSSTTTLNILNIPIGQSSQIRVSQDATGSRALQVNYYSDAGSTLLSEHTFGTKNAIDPTESKVTKIIYQRFGNDVDKTFVYENY